MAIYDFLQGITFLFGPSCPLLLPVVPAPFNRWGEEMSQLREAAWPKVRISRAKKRPAAAAAINNIRWKTFFLSPSP